MNRGSDEGQAATELALVLPLLVALLLCVVQVAVVARDQILVVHAAREAARQAAVGARPSEVRAAAARVAGVKVELVTTDTSYRGGSPDIVVVRVGFRSFTDIPLVGPLLPDPILWAKAAMRPEWDTGREKSITWRERQQERRHNVPNDSSVDPHGGPPTE